MMMDGHRAEAWQHTSAIMAAISNASGNYDPVKLDHFNPYKK